MQITDYVPIEKQMLLDAQKYIERAIMYLAIGKLKYCTGCLIKASKKIELAERFSTSLELVPALKNMTDLMAKEIANKILKG